MIDKTKVVIDKIKIMRVKCGIWRLYMSRSLSATASNNSSPFTPFDYPVPDDEDPGSASPNIEQDHALMMNHKFVYFYSKMRKSM